MIKDLNDRFDYYSISPQIRQISLNLLKTICYDLCFGSYKNELLFSS